MDWFAGKDLFVTGPLMLQDLCPSSQEQLLRGPKGTKALHKRCRLRKQFVYVVRRPLAVPSSSLEPDAKLRRLAMPLPWPFCELCVWARPSVGRGRWLTLRQPHLRTARLAVAYASRECLASSDDMDQAARKISRGHLLPLPSSDAALCFHSCSRLITLDSKLRFYKRSALPRCLGRAQPLPSKDGPGTVPSTGPAPSCDLRKAALRSLRS